MKLLLDMGNTFCKVAVVEGENWIYSAILKKNPLIEIQNCLQDFPEIRYSIISAVQNNDAETIAFLSKNTLCYEMNGQIKLPLKINYDTPETLGKDRIVAACGASFLFPGKNTLIIDAGTCIKYDFLSADGAFKGGAIAPGLKMRYNALNHFTDRLPLLEIPNDINIELTGKSTEGSIHSGVINAVLFEASGFIEKYLKKHPDLTILVTGGDAAIFENGLKIPIFARPELSLIGLHEILKLNVA